MRRIDTVKRLLKLTLGLGVTGTLFGSTCSSPELGAVVAGLEAAASHLEQEQDDISFGDWLRDELDDL